MARAPENLICSKCLSGTFTVQGFKRAIYLICISCGNKYKVTSQINFK